MNKNIDFIYLAGGISSTITNSQVVNWLDLLKSEGIHFNIVFSMRLIDLFSNRYRKNTFKIIRKLKKKYNVYLIPSLRSKSNGFIYKTILLIILFSIKLFSNKKIIIQTREQKHYKVISIMKTIFKDVKFVLEHRGVIAEEYINSLGYKNIKQIKNNNIVKEYNRLINNFKKNSLIADKIINVSQKMNDYLIQKGCCNDLDKMVVIQGGADSRLFYFSNLEKEKIRTKMKLKNKFIIIYTGRLDPKWHMKEFLFNFFKQFLLSIENSYVFCLTPDIKSGEMLIDKYKIKRKDFFLNKVDNSEINNYLNASDFAIILRENFDTNYYSSPTKLAEYLISGTPVILSKNIGDYSSFINEKKLGVVVDNNISFIINKIKGVEEFDRQENSLISKKYYSKQSILENYKKIYYELFN